MKLLFVDPQGNAQLLTPILEEIQMKEPDVFKIVGCTDTEYEAVENGALWIDGKPQYPAEPDVEELKALEELKRLEKEAKEIETDTVEIMRDYLVAAIQGDEELKEELKEEYIALMSAE